MNAGDVGLISFFRRIYTVLKPGGLFILEPQEWETYAKAKRMDIVCLPNIITDKWLIGILAVSQKLKENAKDIKLRPEAFQQVLQDIGFGPVEHLGTTGKGGITYPIFYFVVPFADISGLTGFRRPVDLYYKPSE